MNDSIFTVPPYAGSVSDSVLVTDFDTALAARIVTPLDTVPVIAAPVPRTGLEGAPRRHEIGDNSGILAILASVLILIFLSYGKFRRLFTRLTGNLWSLRKRENAFDDHTSNEAPVLILLALQWSIATGILIYTSFAGGEQRSPSEAFGACIATVGVMAAYYLVQLAVYAVLGYTFTSPVKARMLLSGFTSSQDLSGCLLMPAALVAIFYTEAAPAMCTSGIICYILARIIFNIKGFRIFYHNFSSLLYYILYLCTLEITPLLLLYRFTRHIAVS